MKQRETKRTTSNKGRSIVFLIAAFCVVVLTACTEIKRPVPEPFFAETTPPVKQEFRWSNGKSPKSLDPARAAAAPETDIVRAIYEGLTEIDPTTLEAIPAAAEKWSVSDDFRVWTFDLRKDARWSNGHQVTADDFVSSWRRLRTLGDEVSHKELFQNIVGLKTPKPLETPPGVAPHDLFHVPSNTVETQRSNGLANILIEPQQQNTNTPNPTPKPQPEKKETPPTDPKLKKIGLEAVDQTTLKVTLEAPDKDFPKLVANPIFRPIYGDGVEFDSDPVDSGVVTNGAFTVSQAGKDGVTLDRSATYWNKTAVGLDHVTFVPMENAEAALNAYKNGEIDAVTNADFEPLALKLLAPYDDFRQTTHSALNFYEFGLKREPFKDRRVREALAISIDRQRLADGELEGSTQPATSFLPLGDKKHAKLNLDVEKARDLLDKAGFPDGEGFPAIKLLINRNDTQQRVARAVAKMWKQNLNLETEISVKETAELENTQITDEYDLVRRGVVLPTVDERASMVAIYGTQKPGVDRPKPSPTPIDQVETEAKQLDPAGQKQTDKDLTSTIDNQNSKSPNFRSLTEGDAVYELNAIPLYFPLSYSLVKPYVLGFDTNGLDAPMLQNIRINSSWQSVKTNNAS